MKSKAMIHPHTLSSETLPITHTHTHYDFAFFIRHGRKTIDVSSPFRYSGLSNNAKLELVKSETVRTLGTVQERERKEMNNREETIGMATL